MTRIFWGFALAGWVMTGRVAAEPGMPFSPERPALVRAGVFNGAIYHADDAAPDELKAARTLAEWIGRVTSRDVPVFPESAASSESPGIFLGNTRLAANRRISPLPTLSRDASVFSPAGRARYCLVGESPHALRFGVGKLLTDTFGVSFLMPGPFGAEYEPVLRLPGIVRRMDYRPAFIWRSLYGLHTDAEKDWAANVGLGRTPQMGHALWEVFDAEAFKKDPRMFAMLGGKRVAPSGRTGYEPQPNLAYEGSARHAAEHAARYFSAHPEAAAFSLSINDNMTWDESPETLSWLRPTRFFRNRPDYSDYVFGFMNRVAEELDRMGEPKDKFLTGYAYYHCENVPSFALNPRVFPVLTADRSEWRDATFSEEDRRLIAAWSRSGATHFGLYDYYYGLNMAAPRIFYDAQIRSIRFAAAQGASLFFAEVEPDWGFDGPKCWLAAQLLWNPKADPRRLLESYFKTAYGPAAASMREFHAIVEHCWSERKQAPRWIRFFREESVFELFSEASIREMRDALNAAEVALRRERFASDDADARRLRERMRVRATVLSFERFAAWREHYRAQRALMAAPEHADSAGEVWRLHDAVADALRVANRKLVEANDSPLRVGAPFRPGIFRGNDTASWTAWKLSPHWRALVARHSPYAVAAAVLADEPSVAIDRVVTEGFEKEAFEPVSERSWGHARGIVRPKAPWRTNLFEAEHTRFGHSEDDAYSGRGALLVANGDLARISRSVTVFGGDTVGVRLRYAGDIVPGVHVGATLSFFDQDGKQLRGDVTVTAPAGPARWAMLPLVAKAPADAVSAVFTLQVMNQVAGDSVRFDDLEIRRCANGEILE